MKGAFQHFRQNISQNIHEWLTTALPSYGVECNKEFDVQNMGCAVVHWEKGGGNRGARLDDGHHPHEHPNDRHYTNARHHPGDRLSPVVIGTAS